jgi:hypothetical protein
MGGYVTRYRGNFDFLTIRGSGHMVPQYKPEAALALLASWIAGEDYSPYNASCAAPAQRASGSASGLGAIGAMEAIEAEIARLQAIASSLKE